MIFDSIQNLSRYDLPMKAQIMSFLQSHDVLSVPVGEIEIDQRNLFVRPSEYQTKPAVEGKFETHRVYADLQYVVRGVEEMQTAPKESLVASTEYDPKGDYQFWSADAAISSLIVRAGEFVVFFPGEAHRPCCDVAGRSAHVKKLVFKIKIFR